MNKNLISSKSVTKISKPVFRIKTESEFDIIRQIKNERKELQVTTKSPSTTNVLQAAENVIKSFFKKKLSLQNLLTEKKEMVYLQLKINEKLQRRKSINNLENSLIIHAIMTERNISIRQNSRFPDQDKRNLLLKNKYLRY